MASDVKHGCPEILRLSLMVLVAIAIAGCSPPPRSTATLTEAQQYALDGELLRASYLCDPVRVAELIEAGADVDARVGDRYASWTDERFWSPRGGTPVNGPKLTPLLCALQSYRTNDADRQEVALLLTERGADLDLDDGYGATPLYMAIDARQTEVALRLIDLGANIHTETRTYIDAPEGSPLWKAIDRGDTQVVAALLERGADPNEQDWAGSGLLSHAVSVNDLAIVGLLLDAGASVKYSVMVTSNTEPGSGAADHLLVDLWRFETDEVDPQIIQRLMAAGVQRLAPEEVDAAAFFAAAMPSGGRVDDLLEAGLSASQPGRHGWTGLHFLAAQPDLPAWAMREMIDSVAGDLDITDESGMTPLRIAIGYSNIHAVYVLCDGGADPDQNRDEPGRPLRSASDAHNVPILLALLYVGADPALAPNLLFDAIDHEDLDLVHTLVRYDVSLDTRQGGVTPLSYARSIRQSPAWNNDLHKLDQMIELLESETSDE